VELSASLASDARRIARQAGLKPADAIHLASAVAGRCDQLPRWGDKFRLKEARRAERASIAQLATPGALSPRPVGPAPGEGRRAALKSARERLERERAGAGGGG
jgi:hypothetical protein